MQYKERYDKFTKFNKTNTTTIKIKKPSRRKKISKEASGYNDFWKIADKVKELVIDISKKEFPKTPEYLVIDHFWHWVVKICDKTKLQGLKENPKKRDSIIPKLFREFCKWDKGSTEQYTVAMGPRSKKIRKLLSKSNIDKLSKKEAKDIYCSFHATYSLIQRFDADKKFMRENSIGNIRKSFKHLLDETISIETRIHDLTHKKSEYKLNQFGSSCVQELIGWANPDMMPIRNKKADDAVMLLGFKK